MAEAPYWIVSMPLVQSKDNTWNLLNQKTTYEADYSMNFRLEMPELRCGTLDSLLTLSDDMAKLNAHLEGTVMKLRRALQEILPPDDQAVMVAGLPVDSYLTRFEWNEAKYPPRRPLKELVEKIVEDVSKVEEEMKVRMSEYNILKSQMQAVARKSQGSLAVRDLSTLLEPSDLIASENLATVVLCVPKFGVNEFLRRYETLTEFVVPRSAKMITSDNEYCLYTVIVFKRVADDYKRLARQAGVQVRETKGLFEDGDEDGDGGNDDELLERCDAVRHDLEAWLRTAFSEAFQGFVHALVVRVFVESILRYGLPPSFQAAVMKPKPRTESKLRGVLSTTFSRGDAALWAAGPDDAKNGLLTTDDAHPYVSYTVTV
ncbi:unnamed protein product [Pedinophyceae sp. YPF-701]|nr:unnamed protein product [Pedinophyceae sp. YPF-701]